MKIKSILVSQPKPSESSPYLEIAKKEKINIEFRPFIHVEGIDAKELRTQKIDLTQYTGIILTSKNAVDHYFRLAEEMRFSVPDTMRYICQSEAIANYLQKHVVYRKRKISFGEKTFADLAPLFKKFPDEKYLLPSSDVLSESIISVLDQSAIDWTRGIMYKTVSSNLSDIKIKEFDMLVFFSPQEIKSFDRAIARRAACRAGCGRNDVRHRRALWLWRQRIADRSRAQAPSQSHHSGQQMWPGRRAR